jgi:4-amino-4-deoxy-L-arabinose transferase-like glycosyltransferase
MFGGVISLIFAALVGYLLVRTFSPLGNHALTWLLAPGIGLGVTSVTLFLTLLVANQTDLNYLLMLDGMLLVLASMLFLRLRTSTQSISTRHGAVVPDRLVSLLFYGGMALAGSLYLTLTVTNPHGNWDAWVIWNVRARFLVRAGENWLQGFSTNLVHPDYPLLITGSVSRAWVYGDTETALIPTLIAATFTLATVVMLYVSIKMFRGPEVAMVAVLVVIVSPRFVLVGVAQYADIPLSYFILTALLLTYLRSHFPASQNKLLILAGLAAGMAAWTKNEGILFLVSFVGGRLLMTVRAQGLAGLRDEIVYLTLGIGPMLAALLYFKLQVTPQNDLVGGQGSTTFDRLVDLDRYVTIAGFYATQMAWFVLFGFPFFLRYLLKNTRQRRNEDAQFEVTTGAVILALQFLGYLAIYIITPRDLYWQLGSSLPRLLLHLWPAFLLTSSLLIYPVAKPAETE